MFKFLKKKPKSKDSTLTFSINEEDDLEINAEIIPGREYQFAHLLTQLNAGRLEGMIYQHLLDNVSSEEQMEMIEMLIEHDDLGLEQDVPLISPTDVFRNNEEE